jgi:GntR family transcriptional regulator
LENKTGHSNRRSLGKASKKIPRYQQTTEALSSLLDDMEPGTYLPSEPTLARQMGVSRATLREAMRTFEGQGRIVRRQGVGTYVTDPPSVIDSGIETLESIEVLAHKIGLEVEMGDLTFVDRAPSDEEALKFDIPPLKLVTDISRVIIAKNRPVAFLIDTLPKDAVPEEAKSNHFRGSILDLFLNGGEPILQHSIAEVTAVAAESEIARHLQIQRGDVLLYFESWLYADLGEAVDYSKSYFLPGTFRFHLVRKVASG